MIQQLEFASVQVKLDWPIPSDVEPFHRKLIADARNLPLAAGAVDCIVTSPPYWRKRDYGFGDQIGVEPNVAKYVDSLSACLVEWKRVLSKTGSIFLNVGDTYEKQGLAGIPHLVERAAVSLGFMLRNRIVWAKTAGIPEPSMRRLANRYEYILHFTKSREYYYDIFGYSVIFGNGSNPGDVWQLDLERGMHSHLAPFPEALVERSLVLGCAPVVCGMCEEPRRRIVQRTFELDERRPQAKRAMAIYAGSNLTEAHLRAIQATGISDAGKAMRIQTGTGRNSADVKRLANEAKAVLGGYFREFTFAKKRSSGWTSCNCGGAVRPGIVLDPFAGTGTTARVAGRLGMSSYQTDLAFPESHN